MLQRLGAVDFDLGRAVAAMPWFKDGVNADEIIAIKVFANLARRGIGLAKAMIGQPFLSTIEPHDSYALGALWALLNHPDDLALLREQPWFDDGINDEEAAFIGVVGAQYFRSEEDFRSLAVGYAVESKSVFLSFAVEVKARIFRFATVPQGKQAMQKLEYALLDSESFIQLPFPKREVSVLYATPCKGAFGCNVGSHVVIDPKGYSYGGALAHEVAHYYWGVEADGPFWFPEGFAEVVGAYSEEVRGGRTMMSYRVFLEQSQYGLISCTTKGVNNIQQIVEGLAKDPKAEPYFSCAYSLGSYLLLLLREHIGADNFRATLQELYLLQTQQLRSQWQETYHIPPLPDEWIYKTFLRHTPPVKLAEVKAIYKRWHGGPFTE